MLILSGNRLTGALPVDLLTLFDLKARGGRVCVFDSCRRRLLFRERAPPPPFGRHRTQRTHLTRHTSPRHPAPLAFKIATYSPQVLQFDNNQLSELPTPSWVAHVTPPAVMSLSPRVNIASFWLSGEEKEKTKEEEPLFFLEGGGRETVNGGGGAGGGLHMICCLTTRAQSNKTQKTQQRCSTSAASPSCRSATIGSRGRFRRGCLRCRAWCSTSRETGLRGGFLRGRATTL